MKLLLINPNVTAAVTGLIAAEAGRSASAGTEITAVTARFGTQYIENRIEAAIAGHAVLDVLATHMAGHDAAIIAAFGDPGLAAAREFADIPVFGIEEAALLTAWTLGRRIAIICLTSRLAVWYQECAEEHGLAGRLVSVRPLDVPIPDIVKQRINFVLDLLQECEHAIEQDAAEVIIFGGAPNCRAGTRSSAADPGAGAGRRQLCGPFGRGDRGPAASAAVAWQLRPSRAKTGTRFEPGADAARRGDVSSSLTSNAPPHLTSISSTPQSARAADPASGPETARSKSRLPRQAATQPQLPSR